jgi:hypothetical protein
MSPAAKAQVEQVALGNLLGSAIELSPFTPMART